MEAQLVIFRPDGRRSEFHVKPGKQYVIGRQESADLRIPLASVSREHAKVYWDEEEDELVVEDLGSSNGTHVNGERIEGMTELTPGDVVQIGEIPFQVVIDGHPADLEPITIRRPQKARSDSNTQSAPPAQHETSEPAAAPRPTPSEAESASGGIEEEKDSNVDSFFGFDLDDTDI